MSSYQVPVSEERRGQFQYDADDAHGQGLVTFAGVMLLLAGTLNLVFGIAAIDGARFFTEDTEYVIGDLGALGWFVLILGALQVAAAFAIWRAVPWAAGSAWAAPSATRSCRCCGSPPIRSSPWPS